MKFTRRSILKAAPGIIPGILPGILALGVAPTFLRAEDKAGAKARVLGTGEHTYEVTHDWLTPPENIRWGNTHMLVLDKQHRMYVAHTVHASSASGDAVCVFDDAGKFIRSFGPEFRSGAHGLEIRSEGGEEFLYHCDTNRRIFVKTNLQGKVIWEKSFPKESGVYNNDDPHGEGEKSPKGFKPTNIALADNGDFYVADGYGSSYVHQYNIKGDYLRTFGTPGKELGQLRGPHGIAVDRRDGTERLVVADRGNGRLQYFSMDGKPVAIVKEPLIRAPCHFDFRGELMLVPDLASIVTILDKDTKVIVGLGDGRPEVAAYLKENNVKLREQPRDKFPVGKFVQPHGGRFLPDGNIVITEWVEVGRISLLRKV